MELKPCPFCGREATMSRPPQIPGISDRYAEDYLVTIGCDACRIHVDMFTRRDRAMSAWNTRTRHEPKRMEAPFEIGDIIEPVEPNKYHKRFEVVGETSCYMELKFLDSSLSGMTMKRRKDVLRRDYKRAEE